MDGSSGSVLQGAEPPSGVSPPVTHLRDNQLDELSSQCSDSSASQSILQNPRNNVNNLANGTGVISEVDNLSNDQSSNENN